MLSKNQIKLITSLRLKKFRKTENLFVVEGAKIVSELVASDWNIKVIYGTEEFFQTFQNNKLAGDVELVPTDGGRSRAVLVVVYCLHGVKRLCSAKLLVYEVRH